MNNQKWIKEDPDFYKINNLEQLVTLKNSDDLQEEFKNYAWQFKNATHEITEHILEKDDISQLDSYIFSLAYLYRHSLELLLKAIGFKYILDKESRQSFVKKTFHNLSLLLETIHPYIKDHAEKNCEAFQWVKVLFKDMNDMDKESDSFRYPFGINVEKDIFDSQKHFKIKLFFEKQTHIDLLKFANKMEITFGIIESYLSELDIEEVSFQAYTPTFLEEGGDNYCQSVIAYSYNRGKFYTYVKAYSECAEYLYECMRQYKHLKEQFFIPMCYLYRNAIELSIKEILFEESSYNFQEAAKIVNAKKHSILGLWNHVEADVIKHAQAPAEDMTLINARKYINQIHHIDGQAVKFRYPTDKYMNLHFKTKKKLDIENVANFFSEINTFLSGVCMMMSHHNEIQADMEAEYRADMEIFYE